MLTMEKEVPFAAVSLMAAKGFSRSVSLKEKLISRHTATRSDAEDTSEPSVSINETNSRYVQ